MDDEPAPKANEEGLVIRERRPRNPWLVAIVVVLVLGFAVGSYWILTEGSGLAVGFYLTLVTAVLTGLILERIDSSRQSAIDKGSPDTYWGFRGRPGA
jgi:hypothetical protein